MQEVGKQELAQSNGATFSLAAPSSITAAGTAAQFAWDEYFLGTVRNTHTRAAYLRAVKRLLAWTESQGFELPRITPGMVGHYFNELPLSTPSKKLHLAAIRAFFDVLVQRHVMVINPAHSVRTERYRSVEGKTPAISVEQARHLLRSIEPNSIINLRDRAIIAVLIYTAARAGAVAKLRVRDFSTEAGQYVLRFSEKGGQDRRIPCRHDLQQTIQAYLSASSVERDSPDAPLFRTIGKDGKLTKGKTSGVDICRLVKRRVAAAGLPTGISPHSFRACAVTDLLRQCVPLDDVQYLCGHADPRTTRIYDRRQREVTRNIVERISV